ncbi:hypothetical protein GYMLUDRAFT_779632 [Collybiopsis luxurians FD-317 M1]|uniref:Uncharacterized protein n=1 Tax=Collybiopsis luxurians FD-317 M1 TaxID=944289 RepID=A0A0D0BNQ4_9AGAR|nr:hypothetical protein GYMLUDRAFT_779632 [Collybiopsis luxurians FD-317 M1]
MSGKGQAQARKEKETYVAEEDEGEEEKQDPVTSLGAAALRRSKATTRATRKTHRSNAASLDLNEDGTGRRRRSTKMSTAGAEVGSGNSTRKSVGGVVSMVMTGRRKTRT